MRFVIFQFLDQFRGQFRGQFHDQFQVVGGDDIIYSYEAF
jgi:hypothetical protein